MKPDDPSREDTGRDTHNSASTKNSLLSTDTERILDGGQMSEPAPSGEKPIPQAQANHSPERLQKPGSRGGRSPLKQGPRDQDRVDRFSRVVIGRVRRPEDLEVRGRGRLRRAFENIKRADGKPGRKPELDNLPLGNFRVYLWDVMGGVSPAAAGSTWFSVSPSTMARWLSEGADPECKDEAKRTLYLRTEMAKAAARGECELRVALDDPLAALTRGPLGRSTPDIPGWSDERKVLLGNLAGDGAPEFILRLEIGDGYKTRLESSRPALEAGEEP